MTENIQLPPYKRSWKRPHDEITNFPNVWHQFTTKSRNGQIYKIRIQDATPDLHNEIWKMYEYYFYTTGDELVNTAKEIEDEVTMISQKWATYQCLKSNLSIIAVLDDHHSQKPTIIGGLLLAVESRGDPPLPKLPGDARAKVHNLFGMLYKDINVFEKLNISTYFVDHGLVVKPEYQRLGIASELFKTVEKMAKAFNVPAIVSTFNNSDSQSLAAKLGYPILNEVSLSDYVDEKGQMILPTKKTKVVQTRYLKF